jgi:thiamine-phosphate pyrophosphorylase
MTNRCRLYLISPPKIELRDFAETLKRALNAGDIASFQLRLKDSSDTEIRRASETLLAITQRAGVAFILNDRPDLAKAVGADGVHIGQEDAPYEEARRILGQEKIVGVTCHNSRHLAMDAAEAGADYVAFGAFFTTTTKDPKTQAEPDLLSWWSELFEVPCVAIGGITVENAAPLIAAGADFLAVSQGVWGHPAGPERAIVSFNNLFAKMPRG